MLHHEFMHMHWGMWHAVWDVGYCYCTHRIDTTSVDKTAACVIQSASYRLQKLVHVHILVYVTDLVCRLVQIHTNCLIVSKCPLLLCGYVYYFQATEHID